MQGKELFALKNKHFTIHKSLHAEDPKGHDLFVVKGKFSRKSKTSTFHITPWSTSGHCNCRQVGRSCVDIIIVMGSKSQVEFTNASDNHHVELDVKGDWFDRSASITWGGQPVAHISRSFFNVREIFADKQTVSTQNFIISGHFQRLDMHSLTNP